MVPNRAPVEQQLAEDIRRLRGREERLARLAAENRRRLEERLAELEECRYLRRLDRDIQQRREYHQRIKRERVTGGQRERWLKKLRTAMKFNRPLEGNRRSVRPPHAG